MKYLSYLIFIFILYSCENPNHTNSFVIKKQNLESRKVNYLKYNINGIFYKLKSETTIDYGEHRESNTKKFIKELIYSDSIGIASDSILKIDSNRLRIHNILYQPNPYKKQSFEFLIEFSDDYQFIKTFKIKKVNEYSSWIGDKTSSTDHKENKSFTVKNLNYKIKDNILVINPNYDEIIDFTIVDNYLHKESDQMSHMNYVQRKNIVEIIGIEDTLKFNISIQLAK